MMPDGQIKTGCDQALRFLFEYWTRTSLNMPGTSSVFDRYRSGVMAHRQAGGGLCWLFSGARARLSQQPAVQDADRIRAMIAALEDPNAPLPPAPVPRI
jgi:hypothetical protein